MNQPRRIFNNTVALTIANIVTRASNILILFFMARTLHATGIGIYTSAIAYLSLIEIAIDMGAKTFLIREIAKEPAKTNRYVVHFSVIVAVLGVAVLALFWAILPYFDYSVELTTSLYIISLAILPATLNGIQFSVFVAHQRAKFTAYTSFVSGILNLGLSLYLLSQGYGIIGLIVTFVVIQYLVMITYFYFINRHITVLRWEFEFAFALQMIREIKAFAALSILGALFVQPEIIILSWLVGEAQVGFYSAALKIVGLWLFISQTYMANVYPVLSRSFYVADQKFQIIQDKSVKYLLAISLPLAVGITVAAEPIVNLFYGPGFEASIRPLQIMAWNIPLFFLSSVLWRVLFTRDQQGSVLRMRIITVVTKLAGGFLLIALLAVPGAAISNVANWLLNVLLLGFYLKRHGGQLHFLNLGWRFALAALGMGIFTWVFRHQFQLWVLVSLAGGIYIALVFLLRAFSQEDFALMRKIWQSPGTQEHFSITE